MVFQNQGFSSMLFGELYFRTSNIHFLNKVSIQKPDIPEARGVYEILFTKPKQKVSEIV